MTDYKALLRRQDELLAERIENFKTKLLVNHFRTESHDAYTEAFVSYQILTRLAGDFKELRQHANTEED